MKPGWAKAPLKGAASKMWLIIPVVYALVFGMCLGVVLSVAWITIKLWAAVASLVWDWFMKLFKTSP